MGYENEKNLLKSGVKLAGGLFLAGMAVFMGNDAKKDFNNYRDYR